MPNPVVSFEIRAPDAGALRSFYAAALGWQVEPFGDMYAMVSPTVHIHDEADNTIFDGADAHMNAGVLIGSEWGQPAWKYQADPHWRAFEPGMQGGIATGPAPSVTVYIQVPDIAAALDAVVRNGGEVVFEQTEVAPNVHIAAFRDPAGNELRLILA